MKEERREKLRLFHQDNVPAQCHLKLTASSVTVFVRPGPQWLLLLKEFMKRREFVDDADVIYTLSG